MPSPRASTFSPHPQKSRCPFGGWSDGSAPESDPSFNDAPLDLELPFLLQPVTCWGYPWVSWVSWEEWGYMTHGTLVGAPGVLSQPSTIDQEPLFHGARGVGPGTLVLVWGLFRLCPAFKRQKSYISLSWKLEKWQARWLIYSADFSKGDRGITPQRSTRHPLL